MDEKMMSQFVDSVTTSVKTAISETNSKNAEYEAKITEMNTAVSEKDNTISELNEKITAETTRADKAETTVSELNSTVEELNSKIVTLEAELAACKKEKKVSELNSALAGFTDEQKDFAKAEIEAFNADPVTSEINTVVDKIYAGIGKQKIEAEKAEAQKISELNSVEKADDIYGEIIETNSVNEEISIY